MLRHLLQHGIWSLFVFKKGSNNTYIYCNAECDCLLRFTIFVKCFNIFISASVCSYFSDDLSFHVLVKFVLNKKVYKQ